MKIKKIIMILLFAATFSSNLLQSMCSTACNICSHTTFVPRTMAENLVLELGLHNYYSYHQPECDECPALMSLEITAPYFFKSTKKHQLAEYFLPKCKECITVAQNNTSDVSSPWLQIASLAGTPFSSTFCLRPTRTVIGGAVRLFFDFNSLFCGDNCFTNNWWASIFIPVQQVRHSLHMQETSTGGAPTVPPSFPDVITALNNPTWNYGKFSPTTLKKNGIDDICVKLGVDPIRSDCMHCGVYALGFIPTGKGTKAEYVFEPLVGSKNAGVGFGFNFDSQVYSCNSRTVELMAEVRYARFFKHKELRSIDLFNGDWSRYLPVVTSTNPTSPLPGINFFTQEVEVNPRNMVEVWAALHFSCCNMHLEVGYDFWMRSRERIGLPDQDLGVGIFDISGFVNEIVTGLCPTTSDCARICQGVPDLPDAPISNADFITVKNSNAVNSFGTSLDGNTCNGISCAQTSECSYLNLASAGNPRALSSTIYAAVSWNDCFCCKPVMIGFGGQYEFAHRKSALSQYGVWLKTAISF